MIVPDLSTLALTIQAIGFATGTALCLMLAQLWWTLERAAGRSHVATMVWLGTSLWTGGNLAVSVLQLRGLGPTDQRLAFASAVAWSATALSPTLVSLTLMRDAPLRQPAGSIARAASTLSALVLVALFFVVALTRPAVLSPQTVKAMSLANFVAHAVAWAVAASRRGQEKKARPARLTDSELFARSGLVLVAIVIATILLAIVLPTGALRSAAVITSQQCAIVWAVRAAAFQAKARYADLVLKRTLTIVAAVAAAALLAGLAPGVNAGLATVTVTIALAAIMLATPALFHAVAKFVDGVVLRRPDYAEASRAFAEASRRAPDREALFALAVRHVHDVLGLSAVVAQSAAIQGGDGLTIGGGYVLDVTRSIAGRRLMLEELSYLQTVCTEVAHRLESLAFERERQDLLFREERLRHQLTEAELRALRAQVDPHFLFNTLNAVTDLISSDAPRAEAMTEQLAEFFRYTLARRDRAVATLEQEFDFVRRYLEIERVRFGDRLQVVLRCDPAAARHSVPVLLLQPLVENAVRHGLAPKLGRGHLRVSAALDDAGVSITVEDDGVGPPPEGVRGDGVGLRNVLDRVRTMYGPAATLDVARGAGGVGTRVEIHWPAASVPESAAATASEVRRG